MITANVVNDHVRIATRLNVSAVPKLRRVSGLRRTFPPAVARFRVSLAETVRALGAPDVRGRLASWSFTDGTNVYSARALETGRDDVTLTLCAENNSVGFYLFVADALSASR